jgi:hypothetical protein
MNIQEIVTRISENIRLLSEGNISEIDRDILLSDLRSLYLVAKGVTPAAQITEQPSTVLDTVTVQPIEVEEDVFIPIAPPVTEQKPIEHTPAVEHKPIIEEKPVVQEPVVEKIETVQPAVQHIPEPPLVKEFVQKEEIKSKPATSLNEVYGGDGRSLNERLGGDKKTALNDQAGSKDLKSMIDFNKQYVLTNELFKGDSQAFQTAISRINEAPNIEAAFEYIKTELLPKYRWSGEMQSARLFDKLVRQKFGL